LWRLEPSIVSKADSRFAMQITLPDDPALLTKAEAAGFGSVEEYLLDLVERELRDDQQESATEHESAEEWVRRFQALLGRLKSHNPNFDDSRDSIYPVR
jgi:uncharacterized protein YgfB (UPF0149 family)